MSNRPTNRVAKNTLLLFLRMLLVLGANIYMSRVVLHALGVSDFGTYNVVGSIVVLFSFLQNALNNATYRYLTFELGRNNPSQLRKTFLMAVNVHMLLALGILLLCETVGLWILLDTLVIPDGRMTAAIVAYQFSIATFCLNVVRTPFNSTIIAHERMDFYAYTSIIEVALKLLVCYLLLAVSYDRLICYAFFLFLIALVMLAWYAAHCRLRFPECRYMRHWDRGMCSDMLKYSGWSMVVNGADVGVNQMNAFYMNWFFGVEANAALGIASQANGGLTSFTGSFSNAYSPQIIKSYASGDKSYFLKLLFTTSKLSFYLMLLLAVPLLLNIDYILNLWLGQAPEMSGVFLSIIIVYSLIDSYSAPLWTGVHATGNLRTHQLLMASIKVVSIPAGYLALRSGAPAWTVFAVMAGLNLVCSVVRPIYVSRLYDLPLKAYFTKVFGVVYAVALFSIPIPLYAASLCEPGLERLLISLPLFWAVAAAVIWLVGLTARERQLLADMIGRKIPFRKRQR